MKINILSYTNKATGWELKPICFDSLTLLVGASGVGKTRILKCILDLKGIATGKSLNGASWLIEFSTRKGDEFKWVGEFENKGLLSSNLLFTDMEEDEGDKPKILSEKLYINGELLIERNADNILFENKKTVKLSQTESTLYLLREEEKIKNIHEEFERIVFDDNSGNSSALRHFIINNSIESKLSKIKSLKQIRDSSEKTKTKLYLLYINQRNEFKNITQAFIDVFPYVEDIKIEPLTGGDKPVPIFVKNSPFIQIKEKGVKNWIDETKMSSGMFRTLMHIAELYLCADASVILIDEFENSLGVNCIDELTSNIISAERNLQFIITSHHPYIINNISPKHWKVISRKAGAVVSHDTSEFKFDKSKHKAFTQLINLDIYTDGANA